MNSPNLPFPLVPFSFPELESQTAPDGKRQYTTPSGAVYPSVTTILGSLPSPELDAWRERIGHDAAERKTRQAANRGSMLHEAMEDWVFGRFDPSTQNPIILDMAKQCQKAVLPHISAIHNIEFTVWSDELKVAGRVDNLCTWDGQLAILDYKTSAWSKMDDWIKKYFLQETIYAMCLWHMQKLEVKRIVTVIGLEHEAPQVFVKSIRDYAAEAVKICREYHKSQIS